MAKGGRKGRALGPRMREAKGRGADDLGIANYKHEVPVIIPKGSLGTKAAMAIGRRSEHHQTQIWKVMSDSRYVRPPTPTTTHSTHHTPLIVHPQHIQSALLTALHPPPTASQIWFHKGLAYLRPFVPFPSYYSIRINQVSPTASLSIPCCCIARGGIHPCSNS